MFQHPQQHPHQRPQAPMHPAHYVPGPAPQSVPIYMNVPQHQAGHPTQTPPQSFQIRHEERQVQSVQGSQQSSQMQLQQPIVNHEITVIGGRSQQQIHAQSPSYVIHQYGQPQQQHHPVPAQSGPTLI